MLDVPPPLPPEERVSSAHLLAALAAAPRDPETPDEEVSQSELGRRLGMTFQTVNRWCNGHTPLSKARWYAVLAALRLPSDWKPAKGAATKPEKRGRGRPRTRAH
jgi:hypothetical protein